MRIVDIGSRLSNAVQRSTESWTKLLPVTAKVNAGPPTATVLCDMDATTGADGEEIVKFMNAWDLQVRG